MNPLPRHTLTRIIAKHGREIADSPQRLEALLRDLCGAYRREINILVGAQEERVATDLIASGKSVPREVLLTRLATRLQDDRAYTPEAARWAVGSWAVALGVLSELELEARESRTRAEEGLPSPRTPSNPPDIINPRKLPQQTVKPSPQPKPTPTQAAPQSPRPIAQPPLARAPRYAPPPMPAPSRPPRTKIVQPVALPSPASNVPADALLPSRRGMTLRGCLFSFLLLIALIVGAIFVVPVIIATLQEEQSQPSINDPRIK